MTTLSPYLAKGVYAGQKQGLKVNELMLWLTVGAGELKSLSDFEVAIAGKINFVGYKGDLNIYLHLSDQDAAATSGSCVFKLNTYSDENAVYAAKNGVLTINAVLGGHKQSIALSRYRRKGYTRCELKGHTNVTAYLEPK